MNILKQFPTRYPETQPEGEGWLNTFQKAIQIANDGGIVLFYGTHGTGKTRMSYEIAKRCNPPGATFQTSSVTRRHPCIYTTAAELFIDIRDCYRGGNSESSEKAVIGRFADAALLVIDECQDRGETEFEDKKLALIIDKRYRAGKPTVLISNFTREDFAKSLPKSVLSRIEEGGAGFFFDWPSYRRAMRMAVA